MKVIHVPFCFYPDPVGGTEIYAGSLLRHLGDLGIQGVVAAPGKENARYIHDHIRVRRFSISPSIDLASLYGTGDPEAARVFGQMMDEENPDLIHFHALTSAVSPLLVREAKKRKIPTVFTYHTPAASCPRGTLMRWGQKTCDGVLRLNVCTRCALNGRGLVRGVADLVGLFPAAMGKRLGALGLSGGGWTVLRMRELISARHAAFRAFAREVDHIVAVSQWARQLLVDNQVPAEKITLCRHGIDWAAKRQSDIAPAAREDGPLRAIFLGRLVPVKGLQVVLKALRQEPGLPIRLDVYGIVQELEGGEYFRRVKRWADSDTRVQFHPAVPAGDVPNLLTRHDLLVVPSQWMETGPLVILEAFSVGLPVLASRLGGILEWVQHGVNGWLVEHGCVKEWRLALRKLSSDKASLAPLREGIRAPRTMAQVAEEMAHLYRRLKS